MFDWRGCKSAILVVVAGLFMAVMGFSTGFATHAVLVADEPSAGSIGVAEITATPPPTEEAGLPAPTAVPTIAVPPATGETFDLFWEVWDLIQRDFYGDLPADEELTYGAIRGALNTLDDPFTGFLEPKVAEINREDDTGSFEGIGAYVTMRDGHLVIVNTFRDQPAEKVGLRRGDVVLQVDDTPIENMSIYEAITLIRGRAGTTVRLTVLREGEEPFEAEIVRARIDIPVVESEMRDDDVAYVSLFDFSSEASVKLADAITSLLAQNPKGLILDLRGNPGGWLNEAVQTAGLFLPKGELVLIEKFKDGAQRSYEAPEQPVAPEIPMVVLMDGGSASASEIVAGALQDHGRAVLIGERSFGKGSVQWPHELSNGAELRVTVARWFTPNDRAIHGEGLEPDIEVELTDEDLDAEQDPQLERAVQYLLTGQ